MTGHLRFITLGSLIISFGAAVDAQPKRSIEPADCVTTRFLSDDFYHGAIKINPQGTRVAYLVRSPNLATNRNDIVLYVRDLNTDSSVPTRQLLVGWPLSQIQWMDDGVGIVVLMAKEDGSSSLIQVNSATGKSSVLWGSRENVKEYSLSKDGRTIIYATEQPPEDQFRLKPTAMEAAHGYRISAGPAAGDGFSHRRVFLTRMSPSGSWTQPAAIVVKSPFSGKEMPTLPYVLSLHLSVSPDGRNALFTYVESTIPDGWKGSPYLQPKEAPTGLISPLVLIDLSNGKITVPLKTPSVYNIPLWSEDGRSFVIVAQSPVNSLFESRDIARKAARHDAVHLFWMDVESGETDEIASRVANISAQPLLWDSQGRLLVHISANTLRWFSRVGAEWRQGASISLPGDMSYRFAEITSDGTRIVGDFEDSSTPPEVFLFTVGKASVSIIDRLDPEFDDLTIGPTEPFAWKTSTGYEVAGRLLLPPGYIRGDKYPLVIQTKPDDGWFVCDSGPNHDPSFAPQPIANANMLYLIRSYPEHWSERDEVAHYPKGYPGQVGEAAFQTDIWDSAVDALDKRGMIDRNRVGIIGFSRSGWYTEFSLAHGRTHYRAATATDNVKYSMGEYWLGRDSEVRKIYDLMYGGPPYGESLKNWMGYSISFNLERIRTPLLLEVMGYGTPFDDWIRPPQNLATDFEIVSGLMRLNTPVELYYYPNEEHQPEHPQARLATLQRNLDWYRFWLQGYERSQPDDPDQYKRWRSLRDVEVEQPHRLKD